MDKSILTDKKRVSVRGLTFYDILPDEALRAVIEAVEDESRTSPYAVYTPNAEIAQLCAEREDIKECILGADLLVQDGAGIVLASKILGVPLRSKIAGIDLGEGLIKYSAETGRKVYFLGASPKNNERDAVALLAEAKLKEKYPGFSLCGWHDGYFKQEDIDDIISDINASGADILFVCLGAPRQELWIRDNLDKLSVKAVLGLGGSLDGYAGTVKRAPKFFISINCEWLYRLIKQPSRFGRMLKLPKYILGAFGEKLSSKGKADRLS